MAKVAPPKKKKTKGGKLRMVSGLPKETIDFRLSEEEQICPECGEKLIEVRKTIRRELIVIPAQVKVKEYIDAVYACRNCQKNGISKIRCIQEVLQSLFLRTHLHPQVLSQIS